MSDEFIWVKGWERFQTFQKKRGKPWAPPWIRLYPELLDNPDYMKLTVRQRHLLVGIWQLMARTRLRLGWSAARIGSLIGDETVRNRDLIALNKAGFIEPCSGTVLEQRRNMFWNSSVLELEVEVEEEKNLRAVRSEEDPREAGNGTAPGFQLLNPDDILASMPRP